jgi:hypothetical protein
VGSAGPHARESRPPRKSGKSHGHYPLQPVRTSQQIGFDEYCAADIPIDRILSMLAGEALRLEAYAATGLIGPNEPVSTDLLDAAHALQAAGFNSRPVQ